jgi:hypothetical protein
MGLIGLLICCNERHLACPQYADRRPKVLLVVVIGHTRIVRLGYYAVTNSGRLISCTLWGTVPKSDYSAAAALLDGSS